MVSRRRQRGVGLIEVMIAAFVLAVATGGTVVLMSDWFQAMNDASMRNGGISRATSTMELTRFRPDAANAAFRSNQINAMQSASAQMTFTIASPSITDGDGADDYEVSVSWTDPYLDGDNQTKSMSLRSSVIDDTDYEPLGTLLAATNTGTYTVSVLIGSGTTMAPSIDQTVSEGGSVDFTGIGLLNADYFESLSLATSCASAWAGGASYATGSVTENCSVQTSASLKDIDGNSIPDICDASDGESYGVDCSGYLNNANDPVAADDSASMDEDSSVLVDVLSNDTDINSDSLTIESVTQPASGSATIQNGAIQVTAPLDYNGTLSFSYTVSDGNGGTDSASVSVTVNPVNDPPTLAAVSDQSTDVGDSPSLSLSASDPENDPLTFSASGLPAGLSIDSSSGQISGTLTDSSASDYAVTATVSDGNLTDSASFGWSVKAGSQPWSGSVVVNVIVKSGNPSLTVTVASNVESCSVSNSGNASFPATCGFGPTADSVLNLAVSASTNKTVCYISPETLALTAANNSATVTVAVANKLGDC